MPSGSDALTDGAVATAPPAPFDAWFASKGWSPHPHQIAMLDAAAEGRSALLIAPTGGGKTLAGFLPSLVDLSGANAGAGLHTLYISPLKALAVDIQRNLETPIREMGLPVSSETRTGDTPPAKRRRQRERPPNLLLTTPESLALMLSFSDSAELFAGVRCVVLDELHALAGSKRGDQLALCLARIRKFAPACRTVGLSATVADEDALLGWVAAPDRPAPRLIRAAEATPPSIEILTTTARLPWSGHMAVHALPEVYDRIADVDAAIVFVNTRAQAEIVFQELWRLNEQGLPIALHHGSLAREQRRKVEAAMARGDLRAVVATSSLDLGIDWAAVDLVVQIGAPKGSSRLLQRIGRSNHRLDAPSRALLVPANRFEVLECRAAVQAIEDRTLDGETRKPGGFDVLAQHLLCLACAGPFDAAEVFAEVRSVPPYADLARSEFDDVLEFAATGGYALSAYDRYRRLFRDSRGLYQASGAKVIRQFRMNVGTIVEAVTLKVRLGRGRVLGEVEEYFALGLRPGDTFIFAGELLRFEGIRETSVIASRAAGGEPEVPAYVGGRLPLSTHLADRVRDMLASPKAWSGLPAAVSEWLRLQQWRSELPDPDQLLVETFPRGGKQFMVAYCFEGRNAHQTLGMLLTKRMERLGLGPLGFVATDYVIAVWSLTEPTDIDGLFDQDMLGDDLEEWMAESSLLRRTFRNVAIIAGLIERRHPGQEKTGRQITINSDLIYDVLRTHQPDHILLRATRRDAATGLTDIGRLGDMLARVQGKIRTRRLDRISPLAVPILLEIGRESVYGHALDDLLQETAEELIEEASRGAEQGALPI